MAAKKITGKKCPFNEITKVAYTAPADGTNGVQFKLVSGDEVSAILVDGGSAGGTVTLKAPKDGMYAAATADKTLSLSATEQAVIKVETARWAEKDGTITVVPSATTMKVAVIG